MSTTGPILAGDRTPYLSPRFSVRVVVICSQAVHMAPEVFWRSSRLGHASGVPDNSSLIARTTCSLSLFIRADARKERNINIT